MIKIQPTPMTFQELKDYIEYELYENCYTDKFFFMDFNRFSSQMRTELHNKKVGKSFNQKQKTLDIVPADGLQPGEYGFQGRYFLPDDVHAISAVFLNNGVCTEPIELDDDPDALPVSCKCIRSCECIDKCAKPRITLTNNFLQIAPVPDKQINMGLIIKYEADYSGKTEQQMDETIPMNQQEIEYVMALMIRHKLFQDATEYSEIQNKRFVGLFQSAQSAFHMKHGVGGVKRIKNNTMRPFGRKHNRQNS